jgi:glycosyltransferase involved in cell wall biosynthesis
MRILHFTEAHTVHTDRLVRHHLAAGHDVEVITFHNYVGRGPVRVIPVGSLSSRLPYAHHWVGLSAMRKAMADFRPDIVHGHYLSTAGLYFAVSPRCGVVGSAMGSDVLIDPRATHARLLISALPRWVDFFTSGAPHLTRRMVELGIPEDRIATFPWGVDNHIFHPAATMPPPLVIVSTRNFESVYDIPTLILAFAILAREFPDTRLNLYGDGSLRSSLENLTAKSGIADRVRFQGQASPETLSAALRDSAVYVSTSKSDAASISLLEAMATGLVPVVSDIEANRHWICDGENGLLFPVGSARALAQKLRRTIIDEDLRVRAHTANPRIVRERASWADSMRRLDDVYEKVID